MVDTIIEPNESFDFSKLTLALPSGIQGGAYFTKIQYNNKPLYIQTTKSLTKQGIVKSGKKMYCDLMFDNNSENIVNWFEHLETRCQQLIYEKADSWFQTALEMSDVESAFNSILRVYRSGKYYLVRTNIKSNTITNIPIVKIYNENEVTLGIEDIINDSNVICILEIQGIKFTTRNFQIEIELKQVMVLSSEPIFETCMIKNKNVLKKETSIDLKDISNNNIINKKNIIEDHTITDLEEDIVNDIKKEIELKNTNSLVLNSSKDLYEMNENNFPETQTKHLEENLDDLEIGTVDITDSNNEIKEVNLDIDIENNLETITLKKPNQVYYEIYKEARDKAKKAKKSAIIAYLEAKNIKKTYMLKDLDCSDDEFDNEIEDVSESELEGL